MRESADVWKLTGCTSELEEAAEAAGLCQSSACRRLHWASVASSGKCLTLGLWLLWWQQALTLNSELQISPCECWSINKNVFLQLHARLKVFSFPGSCVCGKSEFCVSRRVTLNVCLHKHLFCLRSKTSQAKQQVKSFLIRCESVYWNITLFWKRLHNI